MALAWSGELSVGNAMMDSDHKNLFDIVNNIVHAIRIRDHYSTLPQSFERLEHSLCVHFSNEENMAHAINFPFTKNEQEHKHVLRALRLMRDAVVVMAAKNGIWSDEAAGHYAKFLRDWLTDHIINEDMLMKPMLQTYPYDFNPGLEAVNEPAVVEPTAEFTPPAAKPGAAISGNMGKLLPSDFSMNSGQQAVIDEVLAALEADKLDLPVLPDIARKIRDLLDDPDSSLSQFVQLLSTDLSISLYLIKAANSAAFWKGRTVGNLHDAIPLLGYRMLYSMVINITVTKLFQAKNPLINQKLKELWEHSRIVAANCYVLAQQHKRLNPEDAILAGLVHDIGALPLYLYADRHYPGIDQATLEGLISKSSVAVGAKLLRSWNFPDALIDVIAEHDNLRRLTHSGVADYVDVVTMANLQMQGTANTVPWKNVFAAERLGYYVSDCRNFLSNYAKQLSAAYDMLGIGVVQAA